MYNRVQSKALIIITLHLIKVKVYSADDYPAGDLKTLSYDARRAL